jgi:hypothetical protein
MRVGIIGRDGTPELFERAFDFLFERGVDRVIYVAEDDLDRRFVERRLRALGCANAGELASTLEGLLDTGSADELFALVENTRKRDQLSRLSRVAPMPSRTLEVLDDRIVVFVHDKAILDEDDIASATLVVYGRGVPAFRAFGPRAFLSPGPLSEAHVVVLDIENGGRIVATLMTLDGHEVWRETVAGKRAKFSVGA